MSLVSENPSGVVSLWGCVAWCKIAECEAGTVTVFRDAEVTGTQSRRGGGGGEGMLHGVK